MRLLLPLLAALAAAAPVAAQVGHDPATSPYRELSRSTGVTVDAGWFSGGGGRLGVGPQDGPTVGARFYVRANKFIALAAGVSHGWLQRRVLDPFVELANRDQGLVDQNVWMVEGIAQMNLTGGKSWHRLAPYFAFGAGAAFGARTPSDTSGYNFGTKFQFTPTAGVRLAPTPRLNAVLEFRAAVWKLSFPDSYTKEPPLEPGTPDRPNAILTDGSIAEWVLSPWFVAGLTYYF